MIKVNDNFCKLPASYLFSEVARKIAGYNSTKPHRSVIKMGIGDVTRPIVPAVIDELHGAVDDESRMETFHGYGPEQGYGFLSDKIIEHDYASRGIDICPDEIFISDGAKSDIGNIGDILSDKCSVAITDPVYPVYVDTNVMSGRAGELMADGRWSGIEYMPCTSENGFVPELPSGKPDIIYLCYPNNPTGTTLTRSQLKEWVDYARHAGALILFDSAYEAFIVDDDVPHSIYEIEGAREVAIEFRSFSKTAGFTGLRCGYTVIPKELMGVDEYGHTVSLNAMWLRRQCTKFNGASYLTQRGAAAIYSSAGRGQINATVRYYLDNARMLRDGISSIGLEVYGGVNAPYIWIKAPGGMSSWEFFNVLLTRCQVAGTPGCGFGPSGEGYMRLTAFNTAENTAAAVERLRELNI